MFKQTTNSEKTNHNRGFLKKNGRALDTFSRVLNEYNSPNPEISLLLV